MFSIVAGASVPLSAGRTAGNVDTAIRCQATPSATLTATSGTVDLDGDGRIDISVGADAMAMAGDSLTVSCVDLFGQAAQPATITVE